MRLMSNEHDGKNVDFMPDDSPGTWQSGTVEGEVRDWSDISGDHQTADVRDDHGDLHEDVTITKPD